MNTTDKPYFLLCDYLDMNSTNINDYHISLIQGDITKQNMDVIVNAANNRLIHGGGVARAIAIAAGPQLIEESNAIKFVDTGEIAVTTAGKLPAKYVFHTVGPIWSGGKNNEETKLASCVINCLEELEKRNLTSIAFPAISTGIYGYPINKAAIVLLGTTLNYCKKKNGVSIDQQNTPKHTSTKEIKFVLYTDVDYNVFSKEFDKLLFKCII